MRLSGLDWEHQYIFSTQSEIGLFPADEESLCNPPPRRLMPGVMWIASASDTGHMGEHSDGIGDMLAAAQFSIRVV